METIEKSIIINAPVEKVFEYIDDPLNDPEWMIGMMEVHEVEGLPGVGRHFHWTFKMVGIPLKGQSTTMKARAGSRAPGLPTSNPRATAPSSR
jgi:uncharacterized protein YndB with AHSA1/START domain